MRVGGSVEGRAAGGRDEDECFLGDSAERRAAVGRTRTREFSMVRKRRWTDGLISPKHQSDG